MVSVCMYKQVSIVQERVGVFVLTVTTHYVGNRAHTSPKLSQSG